MSIFHLSREKKIEKTSVTSRPQQVEPLPMRLLSGKAALICFPAVEAEILGRHG